MKRLPKSRRRETDVIESTEALISGWDTFYPETIEMKLSPPSEKGMDLSEPTSRLNLLSGPFFPWRKWVNIKN